MNTRPNQISTTLSERSLDGEHLPMVEIFHSIQGEGFHMGRSAWFIRLAGCDVGCHWCDTKDSWDESVHAKMSLENIIESTSGSDCNLAIVTGGEPLMHNLDALTEKLRVNGFETHLETSGAHPLSGKWDWITYSPKKFKVAKPEICEFAHELKVVVYNKNDLTFAEQHAGMVSENCKRYLQPEWNKQETTIPLVLDYISGNPQWRISLQTHKYLNIP